MNTTITSLLIGGALGIVVFYFGWYVRGYSEKQKRKHLKSVNTSMTPETVAPKSKTEFKGSGIEKAIDTFWRTEEGQAFFKRTYGVDIPFKIKKIGCLDKARRLTEEMFPGELHPQQHGFLPPYKELYFLLVSYSIEQDLECDPFLSVSNLLDTIEPGEEKIFIGKIDSSNFEDEHRDLIDKKTAVFLKEDPRLLKSVFETLKSHIENSIKEKLN